MKIPRIAINNAAFITILLLIIVAISILSFGRMPRSEDPRINLPIFNIVIVYPGASPEDMEELIVDPIETVVDEIDDIQEILTEIEEGLAVIQIEATFGIDADEKYDELVREVNTIRTGLPEGIVLFDIDQFRQEDRTVIHQYALTSASAPYALLYDWAEKWEETLETIPELKGVEIEAYPEEEVRVSLDFQRMAAYGISLGEVIQVLQTNNVNFPGGEIAGAGKQFSIKTTGGYESLSEIQSTVIRGGSRQLVYLRDIAEVSMDYEDIRWKARFRQRTGLFVTLKLKADANILRVAEQIGALEADFRKTLPGNIGLYTVFEQAPAVASRIQGFFGNLMQGVALVGLIILFFLGWRPSLIIMTIIPLSIMIALTLLNGSGYAIQQISIAALVIALGLLVDNGIVVIENIAGFLREGLSAPEAAAKGAGEVGYAIISSTITTLLAFFPLTQLGEGPGEFLRTLPLTVIYTLVASLILALTLSPILAARLMRSRKKDKPRLADRLMHFAIESIYRPTLRVAMRRKWLVVSLAVLTLVGSVSLFPSIGVSFFPTADKPMLLVEVDLPYGASLDATDEAVQYVESVLDTLDYVDDYTANVGHGNPLVYYNRIPEEYKKNHGQVLVRFREWEPARFYATLSQLRARFREYPGARITFSELKNGAPFKAPIEVRIIGEEADSLRRIAAATEAILRETPGVINVDNPLAVDKTDLRLRLNREKAGFTGLTYLDFDRTVRAALNGLRFDDISLEADDETYPLVVRMPFAGEAGIADFDRVYFATRRGGQIPLRQVANLSFENSQPEILHYNLDRHATVTADVVDADQTIPLTQEVIQRLESVDLPEGYRFYFAGEYENQQSTFGDLGIILALAMVGIFAVLVLQFRSVLQPLIVLSAIPLAVTGSFVALYLSGWSFSFFAFVGLISLIGIVVNNSIILVDYINQLRDRGTAMDEAIRQGAERRFTPIVLTTVTTILGLAPLTASATSLWSPLGWTIIGGMVSSTALTLLVVPVLYAWFSRGRK